MDEYHKISGPLYIKSFLRTCAVDLGLDADHILDLYARFGGEKGQSPTGDMVWEEEVVQVSRVGLPWPRLLMGGGVAVILIGLALFGLRGCGGESGTDPEDSTIDVRSVPVEETTPADVRRGSLLAGGTDSLDSENLDGEDPDEDSLPATDQRADDPGTEAGVAPAGEKPDPLPADQEPETHPAQESPDEAPGTTDPPTTVSRQEEPPPRAPTSSSLPPAVAGNAGTPFVDGQNWPVVLRLVTDLPVQAEVRRDGEKEFQTAAWTEPVRLPMRDIRPGRAYGVREGLVVYWGAEDHFSLRLDRVVGVEVSINGVPRDISSLRPGQEIILDDHSAASGDRR